ncbi:hypothetical protein DAPPUDRAFT_312451 [Daphnia pulex]|uniref:Uncharacterized protein n=1 Tax=Daphnia pulex TaxID=6669 RepID=E9G0W6_DAPPU|nr:hypothetical protein DAPPUDRAFT_312451 [Daphnia pulex]|eukprot:EFX86979.1 hypothetical protein DAPPUDRAFT_312451 [Daphnia pulex]
MSVIISNATVHFITGLIILSYAIQSSRAAPKGLLKKQFESTEKSYADDSSTNELKLDGQNKPTHVAVKPSSVGIWPTSSPLKDIMLSPNPVKSLLDNGMDKATTFLIGANNFLNGNSNIDPIDRFNSNFNTLFTSTGTSAVNNYYNIFANFWVNFDAISQFVRGMENRIVVRRVTAAAAAKDKESNAIVQEALSSLTAVNAQLEALKKNLNNSLRRQELFEIKSAKFKEKESRTIETAIDLGIDKLADILTGVSNVMNSKSNIDAVDRFFATFTTLFTSRGGYNLYAYYYIFSNWWVVFDASAMIFRVWEDRFKERQSNVQALQTQQESDSKIGETLEALSEANAKLALLKDSLNSLIRRKDIRRMGLAALKQGFERKQTIDLPYPGLDETDDEDGDEEEEGDEDEEEPVDEDEGTDVANSLIKELDKHRLP